jgi:predicted HicB family RNase H-like nuclease
MKETARLQDIPADLHKQVRIAAALEGVQIREWVIKAINEKLAKGGIDK